MGTQYLLLLLDLFQSMSSSDHLDLSFGVVIAEVTWYDSTGPYEVIVLVEQKTGPGELSRTCLTMSQARHWAVIIPCPTQLRVTQIFICHRLKVVDRQGLNQALNHVMPLRF